MTEQWIDAAVAHRLIAAASKGPINEITFYQRATEGLIRARTRLLIRGDQRIENTEVPPVFWGPGTRSGIHADWSAGDFRYKLLTDSNQAFGVTFALSGVLEMLPFEQRGAIAQQLSVVRNPA